jgi:hypothetical protein
MFISAFEVRASDIEARKQRLGLAQLFLRADEAKAQTSADVLRIRRVVASARESGSTYENLLAEPEIQNLFECGALWFARPSD